MDALTLRRVANAAGETICVERIGAWPADITISPCLLEQADPRFVVQGDGLVVFRCVDETAVYGITGETRMVGYSDDIVFLARLLNVRPEGDGG